MLIKGVQQLGEPRLQVVPHLGRGGEAVEAVEVTDRGDHVELLRHRLDPACVPPGAGGGERQARAIEEAGGLAARDLPAAAARVGRVDKAAAVVDHEPDRPPRLEMRCRNASRLQSRISWAPSPSLSPSTSASRYAARCARGRHRSIPYVQLILDLLGERPVLHFLERRVDVAQTGVERRRVLLRPLHRRLVQPLARPEERAHGDGVSPGRETSSDLRTCRGW